MLVRDRYSGLQTEMGKCGEYGCHFLTLLSIAEEYKNKEIDFIQAVRVAKSNNWMNDDFEVTVAGSLSLLKYFTNKTWTRREVKKLPAVIKKNEYTEAIYHNDRTGFDHYRRRSIDTLKYSVTVNEGYIRTYYIYTVEE